MCARVLEYMFAQALLAAYRAACVYNLAAALWRLIGSGHSVACALLCAASKLGHMFAKMSAAARCIARVDF